MARGEEGKRSLPISDNFFNVLVLGAGFFLIFFSFSTTQNFATTLNGRLGSWSLGLLYLCFSASNLFSAIVTDRLGEKHALVVGAACYTVFIAANIYITPYILLPASAVIGVGASILWTAQGAVLAKCSDSSTIGFHSGVFWGMFQTNGVFGNTFFALLLNVGIDTLYLFIALTVSSILGTVSFLLLRPIPDPVEEDAHAYDGAIEEAPLKSEEDARAFGGANEEQRAVRSGKPRSEPLNPLATIALFRDIRMQLLLCIMVYSGLTQSFYFGAYPPVYGESLLGWVMSVFAACDTLGSVFAGRLSDKIGRRAVLYSTFVLHVFTFFMAWLGYVYGSSHTWLYFVVGGMLGLADAGLNTQLYAVLGVLFKKNADAAFAFFKLIQSTSTSAAFFYTPYLNVMTVMSIMIMFFFPGVMCVGLMDRILCSLNAKSYTGVQ